LVFSSTKMAVFSLPGEYLNSGGGGNGIQW